MHRNAPLTPEGRLRLCHRIEDGWSITATAESANVSRQTAHKWWRRYCDEGPAGLEDEERRCIYEAARIGLPFNAGRVVDGPGR